jgi:ABC-type antimicrobial peptide transport system permease subunit
MLRNHFKIAWRNLFRNKFSSIINVSGLAIGMSVAMLIGLWISDELSFNKYHKNYDRIVEVMDHQGREGRKYSNVYLPVPLGKELRSSFGSDFKSITVVRKTEDHILVSGDKQFTQAGNYMEADAPEMFSLDMLQGTRNGLKDPNSILISQTLSKKLFGNGDPMNKIITVDAKTDVKVTGVFNDLPNNSEFRTTTFILPFEIYPASKDDWNNYNITIFGQLNEHSVADAVSAKIKKVLSDKAEGQKATHELFLLPMSKWHLYSSFENHVAIKSEKLKLVWFYGIIGVFVLLLACINFMNLSTARSEKRAKEVGIRKAVGSLRRQLVTQFYGESLLVSFFSFLLSLIIVILVLPWFNKVADKDITILWTNAWFWTAGLLFTLITGLLAGSYPALYLSSFNPVRVLKGTFRAGRMASAPRKILVVIQFSVSIALIIGTAFVYLQIQYAKNRPVGYSQAGLITQYMVSPDFNQKYEVLKNEWLKTGAVENVAKANYPLTNTMGSNGGFYWDGKPPAEGQFFNTISVGPDYGKTTGWQLVQGRDFQKGLTTDSSAIILNESAVKVAGLVNPVGQNVKWEHGDKEVDFYTIIGVVKDMVKESPFQATEPSVIFLGGGRWVFARIKNNVSLHDALPKMEAAFKTVFTNLPFDYRFLDEDYAAKFAEEERVGKLAAVFATLAILISCLGLFGLSSYVAEQRTKEIGIRKVLGASVFSVWGLLSRQFVTLILISCLAAIPITWYYLDGWLQNYSYRIHLSAWVFVTGAVGSLLLALIVVSYQAIKAASANPVKSLRTE